MIGFKYANSQESLDNISEIDNEDIYIVSESGEEKIHTQGTNFNFVPSNGGDGQVFEYDTDNNAGKWSDILDTKYGSTMLDMINHLVDSRTLA